ncbi:hypothetical protein COLO4_01466 [Corchorus olitorius]|uniref:Uncharacterized protein n=1 Tax=Corchorus olitorius TaxID=93759 RepID=A0A1R3L2M9_9ROSI|nr:hypothetical protein COLO4_01466 [Corchorus olitorius]
MPETIAITISGSHFGSNRKPENPRISTQIASKPLSLSLKRAEEIKLQVAPQTEAEPVGFQIKFQTFRRQDLRSQKENSSSQHIRYADG